MDIVVTVYAMAGSLVSVGVYLEYYANCTVVYCNIPYLYLSHKIAIEYQSDAKIDSGHIGQYQP